MATSLPAAARSPRRGTKAATSWRACRATPGRTGKRRAAWRRAGTRSIRAWSLRATDSWCCGPRRRRTSGACCGARGSRSGKLAGLQQAVERAQHVEARNLADETAVLGDREALERRLHETLGDVEEGGVGLDGVDRLAHEVAHL